MHYSMLSGLSCHFCVGGAAMIIGAQPSGRIEVDSGSLAGRSASTLHAQLRAN